jgi:uncharacterized membrane protein
MVHFSLCISVGVNVSSCIIVIIVLILIIIMAVMMNIMKKKGTKSIHYSTATAG